MKTDFGRFLALALAFALQSQLAAGQQSSDPEFNTTVAHPAYTKNYPRVVFDEAHNNFHTTTGRYKPFVDLISSDGYNVVPGRKLFAKPSLSTFKILVIANALGAEDMDEDGAERSAFTEEECDVVRDWVRGGGSLLLIADHAPFGAAAESLGKRFGVEMSRGYTFDPENYFKESGSPSTLLFSRENKRLLDHRITQGRNDGERINQVLTFTGQSLKGPEGSSVLLLLSQTARDKPDRESQTSVSAAGRAQGIAFKFGKGRVVVLGEAAMLSAQLAGAEKRPMGMNVPGSDNRQLALNIMHWLSGSL
ncbi:MAG: DUF4350 domain-containing protein [Pyrinomonadaceae bacterium]|jgi:hypothetical protein|nr:DUF4350 domain-containing protein [Pyrinomonadaceae bacterium]